MRWEEMDEPLLNELRAALIIDYIGDWSRHISGIDKELAVRNPPVVITSVTVKGKI